MSDVSNDYVSVVYSEDRTPKTDYPSKLVSHLITQFELPEGARLVELGCGRGEFLAAFHQAKCDCTGLDREESARRFQADLDVRICDVSSDTFPFEDSSVDVVYHKSMIEHVADPRHLMEETYRILRPGGKLIVLTPDWHTQMKNFYEDFTHCRPYDVAAMNDVLVVFGFQNVVVERFHQLPVVWNRSWLQGVTAPMRCCLDVYGGRWLTKKTGISFFRWAVELMVLGYGEKEK